ncbi:MAG: response regulator [Rhodospirillaceae bacterium]|nr:response regulator [Rhodospirillaceae bacterium]
MATVLVLDDCRTTCMMIESLLDSLGLQASVVSSSADALKICIEQMPDAIILDWNMPGMDGLEFQSKIRLLPKGHKPKIIFCTVRDEYADIAKAMSGGADGFIIKPATLETLTHHLQRVGLV